MIDAARALCLACAAAPLAACGDATEAIVTVDVEDEIRADVLRLQIVVEAGDSEDDLLPIYDVPFDPPELPHDVALVPANDDPGRVFRVTAQVFGAGDAEITRGSVRGGYEDGELVRYRILLRGCAAACPVTEHCEDAVCVPDS